MKFFIFQEGGHTDKGKKAVALHLMKSKLQPFFAHSNLGR